MPLSDRFRDLEELIAGAMGEALEGARRSLASQVRHRSGELVRDARRGGLEDLQDSLRRIDAAGGQRQLLSALLEEAGRYASRAALLITYEDRAVGWGAYGFTNGNQGIEEMEVSYEGAWGELARGAGCVPLTAEESAPLCQRLGGDAPAEGLLVPLVLRDRVAAALYADRLGEGEAFEPAALRILVLAAAQGLELQALRRRAVTPTLFEAGERDEGLALWPPDGEVPSAPSQPEPGEAAAPWSPREAQPSGAEAPAEEGPWREDEGEPVAWGEPGASSESELPPAAEGEGPEEPWPGQEAEAETEEEGAEPEAAFEPGPEMPEEAEEPWAEPTAEVPVAAAEESSAPAGWGEAAAREEAPGEDEDPGLEPTTPMPRAEPPVSEATVRFSVEALRGEAAPAAEGEGTRESAAAAPAAPEPADEPEAPAQAPPEGQPVSPPLGSGSTEVAPPADLEGPGWAFRDQGTSAQEEQVRDSEQAALHEEARRLARLLVSEIKLYNEEQVEEGRRNRDLYSRLQEDIDRSRQMYEERVDPAVRQETDYFQQEMVNILAGGDASALGM